MTERSALHGGDANEDAPPVGTAIVRPLRHVNAVRQRHTEEVVGRSVSGDSRSVRAWSWALGETASAPVTDQVTAVPPSRIDIESDIAVAEERRVRGDRENRADGAATVLCWLIGLDDHVPVRGSNRGELVDGFGDVVRSPGQIAAAIGGVSHDGAGEDYRAGALASLNWIIDRSSGAPISGTVVSQLTTRDLKAERLYAEDLVDPAARRHRPADGSAHSVEYGHGVKRTIDWLLGDSATPLARAFPEHGVRHLT
jgi:hypothetical protein